MNWRLRILIAAILAAVFTVSFFPAILRSEAYHNFAHPRAQRTPVTHKVHTN
jgi:hypothetical protein